MKVFNLALCIVVTMGLIVEVPLSRAIKVSELISNWETKAQNERIEASKLGAKLEPKPKPASFLRAKQALPTLSKPMTEVLNIPTPITDHRVSNNEAWNNDEQVLPNYIVDEPEDKIIHPKHISAIQKEEVSMILPIEKVGNENNTAPLKSVPIEHEAEQILPNYVADDDLEENQTPTDQLKASVLSGESDLPTRAPADYETAQVLPNYIPEDEGYKQTLPKETYADKVKMSIARDNTLPTHQAAPVLP